jgi:hypothetical protein
MEYKILEADTAELLKAFVEIEISDRWLPTGGVAYNSATACVMQAMTKEKEPFADFKNK